MRFLTLQELLKSANYWWIGVRFQFVWIEAGAWHDYRRLPQGGTFCKTLGGRLKFGSRLIKLLLRGLRMASRRYFVKYSCYFMLYSHS